MELILGVAVSGIVQFIKTRFNFARAETLGAVVVLALIASLGYFILSQNEVLWQSIVQILTTAGAFYTFIIARFEADEK